LLCTSAQAEWLGHPVGEVLDALRAEGLTFIYNTKIVPRALRVEEEPRASAGVELAREILAAHGLALKQAAPNVYAVVPAPRSTASSTAHVPTRGASRDAARIEEVVVQTSRYTVAPERIGTQTFLTQQQVQNMPRLADETLRALQRLPGTAMNGYSSLGAVRGGEANETSIILDGLRLYEPFHLKNFLSPVSLLDSRIIEGIEFHAGGFPAIYGDRMSAVIDATSVRPAQPRYYELGLNLFHATALAAVELAGGRGHVLLSGRRSNVGDLVQLSENDFGEPHYWDGFARADYRFDEQTSAAFDLLVSSDAIDALKDSRTQRARAHYRNVYAWGTVQHEWSDSASTRVIGSFTDLANERHGEAERPGARVAQVSDERLFHVVGLKLDNRIDASSLQQRFGAEVRRLWGQYDYRSEVAVQPDFPFPGSPGYTRVRRARPEPHGYESSAYWDMRRDFGGRWTVQGGVRVDTQTYDGSDDSEQWSPRLSVLYRLAPATQLRASWGRFFQSQGINELQVEDGLDRFHPAQHADHAIVSVDHAFAAGLDLRVEAYRKYYRRINPRFENLWDPLVLLPEAEIDRIMIAPQSGRAEGLEVLLQLRPLATPIGSFSGWLGYAWARAEDRVKGHDVPRSWDQRHTVNLGIVWAKGPWTATLTNSFHSGWPTTTLQLEPSASGEPRIALEQRNRSRLASFDTLDLRLTRTFELPHGALDVFVEATNALSRHNECCVNYSVTRNVDGSFAIQRDVDFWLPLVPSAGVLWRY